MALSKTELDNLKKTKKIFLANVKMTGKNIDNLVSRIKKFVYDADLKNKLLNSAGVIKLKYLTLEKEITTFSSVNKLAGPDPAAAKSPAAMIVITYDQAQSIFTGYNSRLVAIDNETKAVNVQVDNFVGGKMTKDELLNDTAKQYTDVSRVKAKAGNATWTNYVPGTIPGGVVGAGGGAGRVPPPFDWKKLIIPAVVVGGVVIAWPLIKPMIGKLMKKRAPAQFE